ncbi:hypothetical protein M2273_001012 [Mucilaginibacter lappiensis]
MKYLYKHVSLIFLISTFLLSCKKSSTTPELVTFMKLDTNSKALSYNSCSTIEIIRGGQPQTSITSQGGTGHFDITLNQAPENLKTGQVYEAQTIKSLVTDSYARFTYVPNSSANGVYGYSSSVNNPIGSVTLTEVTSTSIKGTFSTRVFQDDSGLDLRYTITNGTFCSGPSAYTVVITGH